MNELPCKRSALRGPSRSSGRNQRRLTNDRLIDHKEIQWISTPRLSVHLLNGSMGVAMVHNRLIVQGNYDSVMHPAQPGKPAQLDIVMAVRLLARDPWATGPHPLSLVTTEHLAPHKDARHKASIADVNRTLFPCESWLASEFSAFSAKFKNRVELAWNNQLILLPPDGSQPGETISDDTYRAFISTPNVPAHVRCGLKLVMLPAGDPTTPHVIMEALKLRAHSGGFRSYQFRITDEDADFSKIQAGESTYHQITVAHEVGHWLGQDVSLASRARYLQHVDAAACSAAGHAANSSCEYGRTAGTKMALLGMGSLLTPYEAKAWLLRAARHTQVLFGWRYVHRVHFEKGMVPVSDRQKRLAKPAGAP